MSAFFYTTPRRTRVGDWHHRLRCPSCAMHSSTDEGTCCTGCGATKTVCSMRPTHELHRWFFWKVIRWEAK